MDRRSFLTLSATGLALLPASQLLAQSTRRGTFQGASRHITTGTVAVTGGQVDILSDFTFDGAPDPKVALGANGYDSRTLMGRLRRNSGASSYLIPDGVDPMQYNEVWIWCERFNVPLGVARIA